jgi:predicted heme/steroid binding protein/uncharacterized membrane protein
MKEIGLKELEKCNGKDGSPTYIAHGGRVIDVSESKLWKGGLHMKRHHAGNDLTTDIKAAPHGLEVLERYPQLAVLKREEGLEREMPRPLAWLVERFPMLRRHPHPMTVHFPIVFMFSTTIFTLLYLVTGVKAFDTTAFHCLAGGIFFTPVAIVTGLYTWWINYLSRPVRAVAVKQRVSVLLFLLEIVAFVWRLFVPDVLDTLGGVNIIYLLIVLSFLPLVTVIGWFGASLTFPIEEE